MSSLLGRAMVESGIWKNMKAKNGRPEEVLVGARFPETTEIEAFLERKALRPIFPLIPEPRGIPICLDVGACLRAIRDVIRR